MIVDPPDAGSSQLSSIRSSPGLAVKLAGALGVVAGVAWTGVEEESVFHALLP